MVFANFAEAMAEGRGKAQADALRKSRTKTNANKSAPTAPSRPSPPKPCAKATSLSSRPTNSSPPTAKSSKAPPPSTNPPSPANPPRHPRSRRRPLAVTGGTTVLSDQIKVRVTANPGESFMDRMIGLIEGAKRQKTPNEIALSILLSGPHHHLHGRLHHHVALRHFHQHLPGAIGDRYTAVTVAFSVTVLIALLVCLIPTTIGGLLSAIGIAGIDRMVQRTSWP